MKKAKRFLISTVVIAGGIILIRKLLFNEFNYQIIAESSFSAIFFSTLELFFRDKLFKKSAEKLLKTIPPTELRNDEKVLLEAGPSHYMGREAVGGKLTLTDQRLIFKSHRFNLQNHLQEFPLAEIKAVAEADTKLRNVLELELINNESHRFLVDSPSDWVKTIPH
jgi:hypothetical protein